MTVDADATEVVLDDESRFVLTVTPEAIERVSEIRDSEEDPGKRKPLFQIVTDKKTIDCYHVREVVEKVKELGKAKGICKVGGEIVSEADVTFMLRGAE